MEGQRVLLVLVCVLLAFILAGVPPASAHIVGLEYSVEERLVVPSGEFHAYTMRLSEGESVWIRAVSAGAVIDVYTMSYESFVAYSSSSPAYSFLYPGSREQVTEFSEAFQAPSDGRYYIVLDNQIRTGTGAVPTGDVEVAVLIQRVLPTTDASWGGIAVLSAVVAGWAIFLTLALRHRTDPHAGWQKRSWWQKPMRAIPDEPVEYNTFVPAGPRASR